jgi:hypothetical protein
MVKAGKKKDKGNGRDIAGELEFELKLLRSQVRDVGENVILRREGEIETLIGYLAQLKPSRLKADAPLWLRELRQLKLKPHKGRLKDLKEIDQLLTLLRDRLADGPQKDVVVKKKGLKLKPETSTGAPDIKDTAN